MGIRFLAITRPFFVQLGWNFFRKLKRLLSIDWYWEILILMLFWKYLIFGGKMGVAATVAPKGLGPQDPTKKLAHWVDLLGKPLTLKLVFKKIYGIYIFYILTYLGWVHIAIYVCLVKKTHDPIKRLNNKIDVCIILIWNIPNDYGRQIINFFKYNNKSIKLKMYTFWNFWGSLAFKNKNKINTLLPDKFIFNFRSSWKTFVHFFVYETAKIPKLI